MPPWMNARFRIFKVIYNKCLRTAIVRIFPHFDPIAHWVCFFAKSILEWNSGLVINLCTHWNVFFGEFFYIIDSFTAKPTIKADFYGEKHGTQPQSIFSHPLNEPLFRFSERPAGTRQKICAWFGISRRIAVCAAIKEPRDLNWPPKVRPEI